MDDDRWVLEYLLNNDSRGPLWTPAQASMSLDGSRGTYPLEEAVKLLENWGRHWLFRDREMRIRNIDTEEVVSSAIL